MFLTVPFSVLLCLKFSSIIPLKKSEKCKNQHLLFLYLENSSWFSFLYTFKSHFGRSKEATCCKLFMLVQWGQQLPELGDTFSGCAEVSPE